MLKLHSTCLLYFQLIDIIIGYCLIIVIFCASNAHFQMILATGKSSAYHDGLLTPLLSPRNLTTLETSTNGFNVSSDLIEVNNKPKRFSVLRQQSTTVKQPIYPFIKDLISLSSDSIESGKNNGNNGNTNKTVDGDENGLWNYRLLSSSGKANDSAFVEDIFNRFKKPTQSFEIHSPINKQIKSEKSSLEVNEDDSIKEDDATGKFEQKNQSPGSVYYDNNWFLNRNRQGNMDRMVNRDLGFPVSNSKSLLPTSQPMINQQNANNSDNDGDNYSNNNLDNSKIGNNVSVDLKEFPDKSVKEPLFGMPDPGRWYYTKNILNAEPSKVGSTEAKVRTKETKETTKSELNNGASSSSPLDKKPYLSNYPIFDEQLIMTAPHHQYLPNLPHLPHLPHRDLHHVIPHHLNHNHYHHHAHPYRFAYHPINHPVVPPLHHHHLLLHHHSTRRYPKLGPIAYSCCKVVYPPPLGKSAIGHALVPHGSSLNKETVPASASTTPSESVHGLAHEIGANCIPIYPPSYPFGYGPRYVRTFPLALKFFKKAFLFG
ncbi:bromodomain-containing protein DDB_G0270170-like [Tetranychus urticae]|uniref:Uncharacterized protein n=1 Tax=Tetranychus urticae TaxID=32264 RepID=T1KP99_TETUR|nr:bromodomain-containing protein DDB_G0270170-like [Tetranychus urticae]XP_025017380.1 bromodomain-containing protein DDB_G0270170-like [Tetranychus urticae]XP_025017381.1 bromodomain-containing protein DDB_G0270170-like [Tetranychus urticae]